MERFDGRLSDDGFSIEVPIDVRAAFGRARPPVRARLNGFEYRTTISVYGGRYYLGARREVREGAGVEPGRDFPVELELDTEPRTVDIPGDLLAALTAMPGARRAFDSFSFSHRREYVQWIEEAKRPDTRERRVAKAVEGALTGRPQR